MRCADQDAFDEGFYEAILERNPSHLSVIRRLVEVVARQGGHERALELNRRILSMQPEDSIAHYNMACSYSMLGDAERGLHALRLAIIKGYCDLAHLEADSDLDHLRTDLRYFDLIALLPQYA